MNLPDIFIRLMAIGTIFAKIIRQQTTTNAYSRIQSFNQRLKLDKGFFFAAIFKTLSEMNYFSNLKTIESMASQTFVNKKLEFVEELVQFTDSHIFLTGKAGTGKTTFLRNLQTKSVKRMVIVAPTGVAAINAGGQTIHSFFQLPFGPQLPDDAQQPNAWKSNGNAAARSLAAQFQKINRTKLKIMRSLELLVIDEISMVRADVLDAIDAVLRRARRSSKAFGGVQLLMIGDVHQLAPVAKQEEWEILSPYYHTPYFFGSHVLQNAPYLCVELEHIYRQHDNDFITLLNKVRNNQIDAQCLNLLNSRYRPNFVPNDDEGYITLTTHNFQADEINESKLAAIDGKTLNFKAIIDGTFPENNYPTKENLELKIGAQVMFVKNDPGQEKSYYNGKIGRLVGYDAENKTLSVLCGNETITVPRVKWENFEYSINPENNEIEEKEIGSFAQIPLRLAWAITIHKSQGLTFDRLIVDAGKAFAHGQVYVALSRSTSLEGLVLKTRVSSSALINDSSVDQFVNQLPELEPNEQKVNALRHQYEFDSMMELFDFEGIYRDFGRISKVILTNDTLFESPMIQAFSERRTRILEELCNVAGKFESQIRNLHASSPSCEQNQPLQERVVKAVAYFKEHLQSITDGVFDLPFKTDNKAINEQINEGLKVLREDIDLKISCLNACKEGFNVKTYRKTKSVQGLESEKQPKKAITLQDNTMDNDPLYKTLVAWRKFMADELNVAAFQIAPNQLLKAIAKQKPVNRFELKLVKGMGTQRTKLYGEAIIRMVLESLGQTNLEDAVEPEPEPEKKPKVDTYALTKQMLDNGLNINEIAEERQLNITTIEGHVARFIEKGEYDALDFVAQEKYDTIKDYFESTGDRAVSVAKDVLGDDYAWGEIKIVRAELDREHFFDNLPQDDED